MNGHDSYNDSGNQQSTINDRTANSVGSHAGNFIQPSNDPATQLQPGTRYEPIRYFYFFFFYFQLHLNP
jgi:hypothetical protein